MPFQGLSRRVFWKGFNLRTFSNQIMFYFHVAISWCLKGRGIGPEWIAFTTIFRCWTIAGERLTFLVYERCTKWVLNENIFSNGKS